MAQQGKITHNEKGNKQWSFVCWYQHHTSVRLSVCHTHHPHPDGSTYQNAICTVR